MSITISLNFLFHFIMVSMVLIALFMPEDNHIGAFGYPDDSRMFLRLFLIVIAVLVEIGFWIGRII